MFRASPCSLRNAEGSALAKASEDRFAYGDFPETEAALLRQIQGTLEKITASPTLAGYVWTQLTDVQQEVNGLLYFDRTPKLPLATLRACFSEDEPSA